MNTGELIRAIGEALFGTRWQTDLGSHLGVNRRSVQRWLTGRCEPQPRVWSDLLVVLDERLAAQQRLRVAVGERQTAAEWSAGELGQERP